MNKRPGRFTLHIRKRPWHIWLSRGIWALWLAVWAEFLLGSWQEREPRAADIALKVLLASLLLGLALWRYGNYKERKATATADATE